MAYIKIQIHRVLDGRPVRKLPRQRHFGVLDYYMALPIGVCIQEEERLQDKTGHWASVPHRARVLKGRLRHVHARPPNLLTALAFRQLLDTLALALVTARKGIPCKGRRLSHGSLRICTRSWIGRGDKRSRGVGEFTKKKNPLGGSLQL